MFRNIFKLKSSKFVLNLGIITETSKVRWELNLPKQDEPILKSSSILQNYKTLVRCRTKNKELVISYYNETSKKIIYQCIIENLHFIRSKIKIYAELKSTQPLIVDILYSYNFRFAKNYNSFCEYLENNPILLDVSDLDPILKNYSALMYSYDLEIYIKLQKN